MRGELQHSALCFFSSLCPLDIITKIEHSSDREAVRASGLGLYEQAMHRIFYISILCRVRY